MARLIQKEDIPPQVLEEAMRCARAHYKDRKDDVKAAKKQLPKDKYRDYADDLLMELIGIAAVEIMNSIGLTDDKRRNYTVSVMDPANQRYVVAGVADVILEALEAKS